MGHKKDEHQRTNGLLDLDDLLQIQVISTAEQREAALAFSLANITVICKKH